MIPKPLRPEILLCVTLALAPWLAAPPLQAAPSGGTSRITGSVSGADGKPLVGARVVAYHLSSEQTFTSEPTDKRGRYDLTELPFGYFDVAVETAGGLFVANQVVNVPPAGKAVVHLSIDPGMAAAEPQQRLFPGSEQAPQGTASVKRKATGGQFWRSPKGIAIIAGTGAAALIAIAASGGDEDEESVFLP